MSLNHIAYKVCKFNKFYWLNTQLGVYSTPASWILSILVLVSVSKYNTNKKSAKTHFFQTKRQIKTTRRGKTYFIGYFIINWSYLRPEFEFERVLMSPEPERVTRFAFMYFVIVCPYLNSTDNWWTTFWFKCVENLKTPIFTKRYSDILSRIWLRVPFGNLKTKQQVQRYVLLEVYYIFITFTNYTEWLLAIVLSHW